MRTFLRDVPLAGVALVVAIVVALWLGPATARRLRTRRSVAVLLLFGFGLVLAATLTPGGVAFDGRASAGVCDLSRIGLASIHDLTRVTGASLNVLLFLPLGVAVGLLPRTRDAGLVALAAVCLTFVVEATQLVVTPLGRTCGSADIFDNLLGLAIGIAVGIAIGLMARQLVVAVRGG